MSTVIKAGQTTKLLHRPAAVDLADHLREAQQVVQKARQQAADMLAHAGAEALRIRMAAQNQAQEAGFQEGRQQGYKEGFEAGAQAGRDQAYEEAKAKFKDEHAHLVADLQRAIEDIESIKNAIRADAERYVLEFAMQLAAKLTYAMGMGSVDSVRANIARALQSVHERTELTIQVHPEDMLALRQVAKEEMDKLTPGGAVQWLEDPSIARGGCVVRTRRTEVDATLETQIEEIVSLLMPKFAPHEAPERAA